MALVALIWIDSNLESFLYANSPASKTASPQCARAYCPVIAGYGDGKGGLGGWAHRARHRIINTWKYKFLLVLLSIRLGQNLLNFPLVLLSIRLAFRQIPNSAIHLFPASWSLNTLYLSANNNDHHHLATSTPLTMTTKRNHHHVCFFFLFHLFSLILTFIYRKSYTLTAITSTAITIVAPSCHNNNNNNG